METPLFHDFCLHFTVRLLTSVVVHNLLALMSIVIYTLVYLKLILILYATKSEEVGRGDLNLNS